MKSAGMGSDIDPQWRFGIRYAADRYGRQSASFGIKLM
jgi:hypothetical protein